MDVSDFLANLQGDDATPEQDPDWLKELNADDGSKEVCSVMPHCLAFASVDAQATSCSSPRCSAGGACLQSRR